MQYLLEVLWDVDVHVGDVDVIDDAKQSFIDDADVDKRDKSLMTSVFSSLSVSSLSTSVSCVYASEKLDDVLLLRDIQHAAGGLLLLLPLDDVGVGDAVL